VYSVIVLTSHHQFWGERSLNDVIRLYFRGKIEIIKSDDSKYIHAGISKNGITFKMPIPLVVRLLNFFGYKYKTEKVDYSDEAVYKRDKNICQYYHIDNKDHKYKYKCSAIDRSIDHVIPRSKGGKTSFENCVTCCKWHNVEIKKNRFLQEVGLELLRKPFAPSHKKGDMVIINFSFNPNNKAHKAYCEYFDIK
jgi:hypothetical protein